jgi:hypothetical protein
MVFKPKFLVNSKGHIGIEHVQVPAKKWELQLDKRILEKTRLMGMKYVYKGYGNLLPPGDLIHTFV